MPVQRPSLVACVLAAALTAACGRGETAGEESAPPAEAAADAAAAESPAPQPDPGATATAPVTVADIDRWREGMAAELAAVQSGAGKLASARTGEDSMSAMMAVQESSTWEAGAEAAGLDVERYKFIRSELSAAASYLTPHLGGIDSTMLSSAQRAELRESNESQLKQMEERVPPAVVEALRPRAEELRKQSLELVGARLKAAGM